MRATKARERSSLRLKIRDIELPVPTGMVDLESLLEKLVPTLDKEFNQALAKVEEAWYKLIASPEYCIHLVEKRSKKSNHGLTKRRKSSGL